MARMHPMVRADVKPADLENGQTYEVKIRCSKFEKLMVNHAAMLRELRRSGLENIEFSSVASGFVVRGRYVGVTSEGVTLPDRVTSIKRVK